MIKVYITVGSGAFDQLLRQVELSLDLSRYQVQYQIGSSDYCPQANFFRFDDRYIDYLQQADVVICHAGAATVFQLLEMGKKLLIVPNMSRIDLHQQDLAQFVEQQGYAQVCWQLDNLASDLQQCLSRQFEPYRKQAFVLGDELRQYFELDPR